MADGDLKLGKDHYCYICVTGADAGKADLSSGVLWVHLENMVDGIEHPASRIEGKLQERNTGNVFIISGDKERSVSFKITKRPGLPAYDLLHTAYEDNDAIGLMIADGPRTTVGTRGTIFDLQITKWEESLPNAPEGATISVAGGPSGNATFAKFIPEQFEIEA